MQSVASTCAAYVIVSHEQRNVTAIDAAHSMLHSCGIGHLARMCCPRKLVRSLRASRSTFERLQASISNARGAVGSWVREAAMAGLTAVLPILASVAPDAASSCVASATAAIAKQAVERIARMRQVEPISGLMQPSSRGLIHVCTGPHVDG